MATMRQGTRGAASASTGARDGGSLEAQRRTTFTPAIARTVLTSSWRISSNEGDVGEGGVCTTANAPARSPCIDTATRLASTDCDTMTIGVGASTMICLVAWK